MPMVKRIHHLTIQNVFQLLEINYKPGPWINLTFHRHLECVVVPVPIKVGALAEDALVLLGGEFRIVIIVRSRELALAGQIDHVGSKQQLAISN
jgi:hypothetical protein